MGLQRRVAWVTLALVASATAGIAIVRFQPLLVIGAVASALGVYVILRNPFVGFLLYTLVFMLRPGQVYPVLSALHVERVIGALTLTGLFMQQYQASRRVLIDGTRQTGLLLLLTVPILISLPFAYWRFSALLGVIDFMKLLAWYIMVVHLVNTRLRLQIFVSLFLALICYIAFDAFTAYLGGSYEVAQGIERASGQTDAAGNSNTMAATMSATIPILLLLTFYGPLRWFRLLPAAATMLLTATMSVTGSRAGFLGFFGGLLFLWWRCRHRLLVALIGAAILSIGILGLPQQYKTRYSTIVKTSELDDSTKGRIAVWGKALRMVADRPLTGVGIGCFGTANAMGYSPQARKSYLQPHNLYLQVPAEIGLIGALVFFAFLFEILRLNRNTVRRLGAAGEDWRFESAVMRGMAAGTFALLIAGLFGHSFLRYTWYVYAGLGAAMARLVVDPAVASRAEAALIQASSRREDCGSSDWTQAQKSGGTSSHRSRGL